MFEGKSLIFKHTFSFLLILIVQRDFIMIFSYIHIMYFDQIHHLYYSLSLTLPHPF
jgi:hypothetical protein